MASKAFLEPARRGIGILSFGILGLRTPALGTLGHRKSVAENDFKNESVRARRKAVADAEIHIDVAGLEICDGEQRVLLIL